MFIVYVGRTSWSTWDSEQRVLIRIVWGNTCDVSQSAYLDSYVDANEKVIVRLMWTEPDVSTSLR